VYGSPLDDFDVLAPLVKVEELLVGSRSSPSPRLEFLRGWQSLRQLQLIATTALDLSPLANSVQLFRLGIHSPHPVGLDGLEALVHLKAIKHLSLHHVHSDQFQVLQEWQCLTFAQLIKTNLDSLAGFDQLTNLEHLDLRGSPVSDLSPLAALPKLIALGAAETHIETLMPSARAQPLLELNVSGTRISNLHPLMGLGLTRLDLSGCPITDIDPLASCLDLERVDLSNTEIASVRALHGLKRLRSLDITGTAVRDLGPAGALPSLRYLGAKESRIENIAALAPGSLLQGIDISSTPVRKLDPLRDAKECRSLNLRGSKVSSLDAIINTGSTRWTDHGDSREFLDFRDTPAANANSQLSELAKLAESDASRCFFETKRYLEANKQSSSARRPFGRRH
jgi:Leucine-rich repeat (LRR) protein